MGPDLEIKFNASKCQVLSISKKRHLLVANYVINGKTLEHVTSQKDLGVMISSDLKWKTQICEQVSKANRMLGKIKPSTSYSREKHENQTFSPPHTSEISQEQGSFSPS